MTHRCDDEPWVAELKKERNALKSRVAAWEAKWAGAKTALELALSEKHHLKARVKELDALLHEMRGQRDYAMAIKLARGHEEDVIAPSLREVEKEGQEDRG